MFKRLLLSSLLCFLPLTKLLVAVSQAPPKFNPPRKYYLALGDSLAFGFQFSIYNQHYPFVSPELFNHGYVDEFGHMLEGLKPELQTVNFACPGERTRTFIDGICPYPFELHNNYSGSQLEAAITFLSAHPGEVSPITFNLGTNDLNDLQALCGSDLSCYQVQGPIYLSQISTNLDHILGDIRRAAPDSEVITFTNYNVSFLLDPRFLELTEAFNAVVTSTAAAHRVRVADVFAAFNNGPQPAAICTLTLVCTAADPHPSDLGYRIIAEQIWQVSGYEQLER